jgi:hypothetical protein
LADELFPVIADHDKHNGRTEHDNDDNDKESSDTSSAKSNSCNQQPVRATVADTLSDKRISADIDSASLGSVESWSSFSSIPDDTTTTEHNGGSESRRDIISISEEEEE